MVALSLYKGNLHKVPEAPRRWLMPTPKISLKDFRNLLRRRSRALSRLLSTTTSNPNPNPNPSSTDNGDSDVEPEVPVVSSKEEEVLEEKSAAEDEEFSEKSPSAIREEVEPNLAVLESEEKVDIPVNPSFETSNKEEIPTGQEKRKVEIEDKLQILNTKKHGLVQLLKQILNAEEELKRRSSMQGMSVRSSPLPLQVDTTNDTGSMTRINTPRIGSDGNVSGEIEGGGDDVSNQNMLSRNLLRVSSTSPSSDSQIRKTSCTVAPHSSRSTLGVIGSPSRFAPLCQQGHPLNLPSVSTSGTNYVASSPSPAASGGTSVFRDGQLSSPWN